MQDPPCVLLGHYYSAHFWIRDLEIKIKEEEEEGEGMDDGKVGRNGALIALEERRKMLRGESPLPTTTA